MHANVPFVDLVTLMCSVGENSLTYTLNNVCTFSVCYSIKSRKAFIFSDLHCYLHTHKNMHTYTQELRNCWSSTLPIVVHKTGSWDKSRLQAVHVLVKETKIIVTLDSGVLVKASKNLLISGDAYDN